MGSESKKKTKNKKSRTLSFFKYLLLFLVLFLMSSIVAYNYTVNKKPYDASKVLSRVSEKDGIKVKIPKGSSTSSIANILYEKGIIKYPLLFKVISKYYGYDSEYKSGEHVVSKNLSYEELMVVLSSNPVTITVTIPEGKNFYEIVSSLKDKKLIDKDSFVKTANNPDFNYKFLEGLPTNRDNLLEGYMFPDTYFFDPVSSDKEIIAKFLDNFDLKFTPAYYERAEELNMTVDQIITLASIIERETKLPNERMLVSSVFHNRLKSNNPSIKKLQSCATVQYALFKRDGKTKPVISEEDTRINDPYNTYLAEGLPPGPICNPGIDAIEAALYPDEESQYLYFVAKGDGSHEFSKTLAEHQAAVTKYGTNPGMD